MATLYVSEILDEINKAPELLTTKYKGNFAIVTLLRFAFDPSIRFKLPKGVPPFRPSAEPMGMSPGNFYQYVRKFPLYLREDISSFRLEQLFIQMLESLHPAEAEICILIKDQKLTEKYPSITMEYVIECGIVAPTAASSNEKSFDDSVGIDVVSTQEGGKSENNGKGKNLTISIGDGVHSREFFGVPSSSSADQRGTSSTSAEVPNEPVGETPVEVPAPVVKARQKKSTKNAV